MGGSGMGAAICIRSKNEEISLESRARDNTPKIEGYPRDKKLLF
jgi:hypothetical protein